MITIEVDNKTVEANEGEMLLTVLKREGIHVPTLCYIEGLPPSGACRSWTALYRGCAKLCADLEAHIALENDVLFPQFE